MWNFKDDLIEGKEMEVKVMNLLNENWFNLIQNPNEKEMDLLIINEWIEVKSDKYAKHSWNFYIEFECNWKPSWLLRDERVVLKYWAHSDWERLFLLDWFKFTKLVLEKIELCRDNKSNTSKGFRVVENWGNWWRTKGLLFPVEEMAKVATFTYNL